MPGCGWRGSSPAGIAAVGRSGGTCSTTDAGHLSWSISLEPWPPPDPSGTGGKGRMPAVNDVGEPCAGEPHARFDGRGLETEARNLTTVTGVAQPTGKPAEHRPRPYRRRSHRASPRPYSAAMFPSGVHGVMRCAQLWELRAPILMKQ